MVIIGIYLFVIGCCLGSFINVVIYRLPLNQSIVYPKSSCTICNSKIKWFDNIPIISWVILGGKCRNCRKVISFSYPIVEFFTGILVLLNLYANPTIYSHQAPSVTIFFGSIFSTILISLAILDFKFFWLPKALTLSGLVFGLSTSLIVDLFNDFYHFDYSINTLTASILGFTFFILLSRIGEQVFKKPVIGGGDAKFGALIGAWLGIQGLFISIWLAFFLAGIFVTFGLILKKIRRNQKIPFGVFLALSSLLVWYFGNQIFLKVFFLQP